MGKGFAHQFHKGFQRSVGTGFPTADEEGGHPAVGSRKGVKVKLFILNPVPGGGAGKDAGSHPRLDATEDGVKVPNSNRRKGTHPVWRSQLSRRAR
ncbi:hypothetical protein GCM10007416_05790 [Kroppenstedtia guangzhouensis]|uniref:Uncharacterized protein n=1 Tax=Kroppenstedtia guangzhouensis TaxID=1274356 RepID=A0ABQ1G4M3_9BACL|nr:hypothetical protein GCM10007416_05790 [Kroppenstedtia guangzhouensis]